MGGPRPAAMHKALIIGVPTIRVPTMPVNRRPKCNPRSDPDQVCKEETAGSLVPGEIPLGFYILWTHTVTLL